MTYFEFRQVRGRGTDAYVGPTYVGRVALKQDWHSRLTLQETRLESFRAIRPDGVALPLLFRSRHDAAEALYAALVDLDERGPGTSVGA